jgi:hypothetical protein
MSRYALVILAASFLLLLGADVPKREARANGDTVGEKLRKAFPGGEVENAPIRLDIRSKRLLIAADRMTLEADGRVKLVGCAIARFQAPKGASKEALPTTIRCQFAHIKLDRPIHTLTPSELSGRKIVSVELSGGIHFTFED